MLVQMCLNMVVAFLGWVFMMCKLMQRLLVAETSGLSFPCIFFMWAQVLEGQPCQPFDGSNPAKKKVF